MNNIISYKGVKTLIESHIDDPVFISKLIKDMSINLSNQDSVSESNIGEVVDIFKILSRKHSSYLWRYLSKLKCFVDASKKRDSTLIKLLVDVYSDSINSNDSEKMFDIIIADLVTFNPVCGNMLAYAKFVIHNKGNSINLKVNNLRELILTVSKEFLENRSEDEVKLAITNETLKVLFSEEWVDSDNLIKDIIRESEAAHTELGWRCDMLEVKKMLSVRL